MSDQKCCDGESPAKQLRPDIGQDMEPFGLESSVAVELAWPRHSVDVGWALMAQMPVGVADTPADVADALERLSEIGLDRRCCLDKVTDSRVADAVVGIDC